MFLLSTWPAESSTRHDTTTADALIEPYGIDQMYVIKGHLFNNTWIYTKWMIFTQMKNEIFTLNKDETMILIYDLT